MTQPPPSPPPDPAAADPALAAWLGAVDAPSADRALADLVERVAMPVIRQTIGRKVGGAFASDDAQEAISRVREQLVRAARRMREPGAAPIRDFAGYVATVSQTVWAECLRAKYPARAMLSHRLRYLLENRTNQTGFALWHSPTGELVCGFAAWQTQKSPPASVETLRRLQVDPRLTDGAQGHAASTALPQVVARSLRWLGGPTAFADLLAIIADRLNVSDSPEPLEPDTEVGASLSDPAPGPEDALRWREYLAWLWTAIGALPLRQRRAFLLHSTAAHELEYGAVAGIRQQAEALDLTPEAFAAYWTRLPLDDLTIAALLGVTRQQVINLRKVARGTLGAAWAKWLSSQPKGEISGHNATVSPSR